MATPRGPLLTTQGLIGKFNTRFLVESDGSFEPQPLCRVNSQAELYCVGFLGGFAIRPSAPTPRRFAACGLLSCTDCESAALE